MSFFTQIEQDWSLKPFVALKLINGQDECPVEEFPEEVLYEVWPGTYPKCKQGKKKLSVCYYVKG